MPGYPTLKFIFTFSLLYLLAATASAADTLYFKGRIKISKNLAYNYSLRFTISAKNQITGYSLSDPGGPTETKTKIYGTYDTVTHAFNFEEKSVLRSRVDLEKNFLCFVKATLTLKESKFVQELSGKFIGIEPGKPGQCAAGEIKLINTSQVKVFLKQRNPPPPDTANKATVQIKKEKETPVIKQEETPNIENPQVRKENTIVISDAKGKEISITGNKVKLSIWDNGEVDGDKISILLNDKYILENYTVTFTSKIIEVTLSDQEVDIIKIIALNEGNLPPNTAAIRIESTTEQYPIITKANVNEVRTIYLRKKNFK